MFISAGKGLPVGAKKILQSAAGYRILSSIWSGEPLGGQSKSYPSHPYSTAFPRPKQFRYFEPRRFSVGAVGIRDDDSNQGSRHLTLVQLANNYCDKDKYPPNSFSASDSLRNEALDVLRHLARIGSRDSVKVSLALTQRLRKDFCDDPIDNELLIAILENWDSCTDNPLIISPNADMYATILRKAAESFQYSYSLRNQRVQEWWSTYQGKCSGNDEMLQKLNESAENILIQMNARDQDHLVDAIKMAKGYVERQEDTKLLEETFLALLIGALRCPPEHRPEVEKFLEWVGERYQQEDEWATSIQVESIFLFAWAAQLQSEASENESPEWLLRSLDWIGKKVHAEIEITCKDYEKAIQLWAKAGETARARELLMNMFQKWERGEADVVPNLRCCNAVLSSLAVSDIPSRGAVAIDLLDKMDSHGETLPNYASYSHVLQCLKSMDEPQAATAAMRLLHQMADAAKAEAWSLRAPTMAIVMTVLGYKPSDWRQMDELLIWVENQLEEGYLQGTWRIQYYDHLLLLLSRSQEPDIAEQAMSIFERVERLGLLGPDSSQFLSILVNCLSKSDNPNILPALAEIMALHEDLIGSSLKLSNKTHTFAMCQFAECGEAERAESFLIAKYERFSRNQSPEPTVWDFNKVLEAWSNSAAPRAAERADAILQHMKSLHETNLRDAKPNQDSYKQLLRCWKNSSLPQAEQRMEEIREEINKL